MTTIIRVKRHLQDDPVEAVRLECKRRKTEEAGASSSFEKVLNFVGTVEKKDDCIAQRTVPVSFDFRKRAQEKQNVKNYNSDVLSKIRKESKARSDKNRYKVISCMRSTQDEHEKNTNDEEKPKDVAIFDVSVEKKEDDTLKEEKNLSEDAFVYDIYTASFENEDFHDIYLDNIIGIEPYTSHTVLDMEYRNPEDYADELFDPDEDDSNDENNWRNDYPDEEESDSEEIDILTCEFDKFGRGDCELSSDDGEENYLNCGNDKDNSNYYCYESDEEYERENNYEKFKRNFMKHFNASENFDGDEEDEETF